MAYLTEINVICQESQCGKRAVVELHRHDNEAVGKYCRTCGEYRLQALKRQEAAMWEARSRSGTGTH